MLNGLIWVVVIFVLQAVIAGLAKRAQQNAQQNSPQNAQGTGSTAASSGVASKRAGKTSKPPKVAAGTSTARSTASMPITDGRDAVQARPTAVEPPMPTVTRPKTIITGKKSASPQTTVTRGGTAGVQRPGGVKGGQPTAATPKRSSPPSVSVGRAEPRELVEAEETRAMASRAKVMASVARIRSVESSVAATHVAGLGKPSPSGPRAGAGAPSPSGGALTPNSIAASLRNPQRIREAIVLSEVLGPPRGMR